MFLLITLQLLILILFGWLLVFEVIVPIARKEPLFPMFRKAKKVRNVKPKRESDNV